MVYDCFCLDLLREPRTMSEHTVYELDLILMQTQAHEYRYFRGLFSSYYIKVSHCPYCQVDGRKRF